MKSFTRRFKSKAMNHCYQNTVGGYLLFYSISDYLVYFTIFCTCAIRYGVTVLELCQMPDHVHSGVIASSLQQLRRFIQEVSSFYAREDSITCKRTGALFNAPFGSAPKIDLKKIKTILIYIGNNPVERDLCNTAIEYRWNYLAYGKSNNPFSEKLIIRNSSWAMKKAVREIKFWHKRNRHLTYSVLQRLFASLDRREGLQLIDYIITTYSVIDYDYASRFFGGLDNMIESMKFNTGSEYEIKEQFIGKSDKCYSEIASWLLNKLHLKDIHEIFSLDIGTRTDLMFELYLQQGFQLTQIAKYLRVPIVARETQQSNNQTNKNIATPWRNG